jgi:hypothetical protein
VEGMIQSRDELILETSIAPINCLWGCGSFSLSCLREIHLSLLKAILLQEFILYIVILVILYGMCGNFFLGTHILRAFGFALKIGCDNR